MRSLFHFIAASLFVALPQSLSASESGGWVVSWTGSVQGPYPVGNPSAQPDQKFAFPDSATGARNQTFRLIVRPDLWGRRARIRLSNAFGKKTVTFDGVYAGLQLGSAALVRGSNQPVTFGGKSSVSIAPGGSAWSDPITLSFVKQADDLAGRALAVSFHIVGDSGPMTWHAKALTTSYVSAPDAGAKGNLEDEAAFPFTTASWFFLDAVEMSAPADAFAIMAFGDSITDGTASTMNGDDRWPNVLSRRLKALYGNRVAVVNGGIGGNQIAGPAEYSSDKPFPGGPSSGQRLERDVLSLSGISSVIWLEGINDFSKNGNASADEVIAAMKDGVARLRKKWPQIRVIGATVTTALGSSSPAHGFPEQDAKRKALNDFVRTSGTFDAVIDFDKATLDPQSGGLKAEFIPESTTGGTGDKLHPNRTGYLAMGQTIDLELFKPPAKRTTSRN
ncbi:MAG TPA: GDSL-type esterase/lipase family protein [Bradyrhizobium sp.]|uniref:GDSL-type esterase/lipase family protein n=1 Tax=Bradyrhizobium sp. TaxID=376 RepID=UPI002D7FFD1D|nr:GDSL-type esterase/lipase family protein [Bradyrhizobium sp.]HET7885962.1 GDSL-type esterase/lipase family protein [Bradyrhizobium sp.]